MSDEMRVSDKEIAAIEQEVASKNAKLSDDVRKEAEVKVRKEVELEHKVATLEAEKKAAEAMLSEQKSAFEKAKSESETLVKQEFERRVAQELATRKALVNNTNPFAALPPQAQSAKNLTPEQVSRINEESFAAQMRRMSDRA